MALSSDLAAVFSLIQQQQALEQRKEERHQDMALQILQIDQRKADRAQEILLKEYYDKKVEVRQTEKMFDKYDGLGPADVSRGGRDIIRIVDSKNNIDMEAITGNLDALSSYQSQLESSLGQLKGQAQTLKEMQMDFAGPEGVLQQHEYEAFQEHALKALEEGGLGWETTAGADVEYYKKDPTTRQLQAMQVTERMKSGHEKAGGGDYTIFQHMMTLGEGEDLGDLADRLEVKDEAGKTIHRPSEKSLMLLQNMVLQTNFEDFVIGIETYPSDLGGDELRADIGSNFKGDQIEPYLARLYSNISGNLKAIQTLDTELAGINETTEATNLDLFVSDISGVTNKEALFGLYDQATEGLDPSQHAPFFSALEAQLGGEDLGAAYMEFKGFAGGVQPALPDIEIDSGALRSLEAGFPSPENIFIDSLSTEQIKIPGDKDYYLDDEFEQFLEQLEE